MNETIQIYLLEAYRLYLKNCYEKEEAPDLSVKEYFYSKIKELSK